MSEKVLGFRKSEITQCSNLGEEKVNHYLVHKSKLVPVVSLEEHERIVNEEKKKLFDVINRIANEKSVSLEWLKKEISKPIRFDGKPTDEVQMACFIYGKNLLLSAEKEANSIENAKNNATPKFEVSGTGGGSPENSGGAPVYAGNSIHFPTFSLGKNCMLNEKHLWAKDWSKSYFEKKKAKKESERK